jgi:hypothetical protein
MRNENSNLLTFINKNKISYWGNDVFPNLPVIRSKLRYLPITVLTIIPMYQLINHLFIAKTLLIIFLAIYLERYYSDRLRIIKGSRFFKINETSFKAEVDHYFKTIHLNLNDKTKLYQIEHLIQNMPSLDHLLWAAKKQNANKVIKDTDDIITEEKLNLLLPEIYPNTTNEFICCISKFTHPLNHNLYLIDFLLKFTDDGNTIILGDVRLSVTKEGSHSFLHFLEEND